MNKKTEIPENEKFDENPENIIAEINPKEHEELNENLGKLTLVQKTLNQENLKKEDDDNKEEHSKGENDLNNHDNSDEKLPDDLDINALKEKMEALQRLLAPKQDNFEELLKENQVQTKEIDKIIKDTENIVSYIDQICQKAIKNDFENYTPILEETNPPSYKKLEKKIKKIKSKDEKEHVESLLNRIKINEKRIESLKSFLNENQENSILKEKENFDFIEKSLNEENLMTEHYLDYVFKQNGNS